MTTPDQEEIDRRIRRLVAANPLKQQPKPSINGIRNNHCYACELHLPVGGSVYWAEPASETLCLDCGDTYSGHLQPHRSQRRSSKKEPVIESLIMDIVKAMKRKGKNSVPVLTTMYSQKPCFGCDKKLAKGSEQYLVEALDEEICSRCCGQVMRKLGRRYSVGNPRVRGMIFIKTLPKKR